MAFDPKKFIEQSVEKIKRDIGEEKAIIAVSGGVDSSTAALLMNKAIGKRLISVFVDTGFLRENEAETVKNTLQNLDLNLWVVDASETFLSALKCVIDPEEKRRIIGETFIRIFERIAKEEGITYLVQGTIGPDWIESGGEGRSRIKSHHNVAGIPPKISLKIYEPLRDLYKYEVRLVGKELGLEESIYDRQPFPGPGLAVRVVGEVTKEKIDIVRKINKIVEEEIDSSVVSKEIVRPWQYFGALLPVKTVGVRGDERAYQYVAVVRCVRSIDGMTADFSNIPHEILQRISTRITNEIPEVGRVVYDITNKPPACIEME